MGQSSKAQTKYAGQFANNQISGFGVYVWPDGSVYTGEWKNGRMEGKGKYISSSGNLYDGSWLNNMRHG